MNKRVIIIGGGIVGCLSALEFKKKGFDLITNCQVKEIDEKKKYNSIY